jgi:hypothetical protein
VAEIPIQHKEGHSIWPWILGLIVLLLVIWFIFGNRGGTTVASTAETTASTAAGAVAAPGDTVPGAYTGAATGAAGAAGMSAAGGAATATAGAPPAVADFDNWIATADSSRDEATQHAYTAGGLNRLAAALASLGASGPQLDSVRAKASTLASSSSTSAKHADEARSAFLAAAAVFDSLATSHPGLDATKVRSAAMAMKPGAHLLDQKDHVQAFFEAARDALRSAVGTT